MEKLESDKEILVLNDEIEDDPEVVHDTYQNIQDDQISSNHLQVPGSTNGSGSRLSLTSSGELPYHSGNTGIDGNGISFKYLLRPPGIYTF